MKTTRTDYHARNAIGTTLATFDTEERARKWVKAMVERFPTLRAVKVTITVEEETVYRPREASRGTAA